MNEPRVFKNSPATLILIVVLFLVLIGGILFGVGFDDAVFILPIALFALIIFGSVFIAVSSKVTISEDEITVQNILGSRGMRWTEIHRVSGRGYNIKLHNFDGDVTVSPSPGLPGYIEVIDIIGSKRPDLFSPQEYGEMRRAVASLLLMVFLALLLIGGLVIFVFFVMDTAETSFSTLTPLLIFVLIVVFAVVMNFSVPRAVTLEGSSLTLKYLTNEKTLRTDEIKFIQLGYTQSRNGKHYYVALHQVNGKQIRLSGLSISLPIAYLVLKNWHQGSSGNMRQPQNNIAPNESDNSGR